MFYNLRPEVIAQLKHLEGIDDNVRPLPTGRFQRTVWMLFEYPDTSMAASLLAILSVSVTMITIMMLCIETMPYFAKTRSCLEDDEASDSDDVQQSISNNKLDPFFVVETVCTAWFTIELLTRFAACPSKVRFWKDYKNLIDLISMLPYYIDVVTQYDNLVCVTAINLSGSSSPSLSYLRAVRLARIFKLTKHCVGLQVHHIFGLPLLSISTTTFA